MKTYTLAVYDFIGNVYNTVYKVECGDDGNDTEIITELCIQTDSSLKMFKHLRLKWVNAGSAKELCEVIDSRDNKAVGRLTLAI